MAVAQWGTSIGHPLSPARSGVPIVVLLLAESHPPRGAVATPRRRGEFPQPFRIADLASRSPANVRICATPALRPVLGATLSTNTSDGVPLGQWPHPGGKCGDPAHLRGDSESPGVIHPSRVKGRRRRCRGMRAQRAPLTRADTCRRTLAVGPPERSGGGPTGRDGLGRARPPGRPHTGPRNPHQRRERSDRSVWVGRSPCLNTSLTAPHAFTLHTPSHGSSRQPSPCGTRRTRYGDSWGHSVVLLSSGPLRRLRRGAPGLKSC